MNWRDPEISHTVPSENLHLLTSAGTDHFKTSTLGLKY